MISDLGLIKLFLVSGLICQATAVVCPHLSQWNLRTKARCNSSLPSYNCLYDESTSTYVEFCTRTPDFQRPGYKFIIRGNIDGIECEKNKFQPFKFWTNGSYDCLLQKSGCNEPGQIIHDVGNSTSDRTCRCDYTRGFAFVTSPKQNCFCHPSREDCSCFLKPCSKYQVMTPDYKCIEAIDWTGIFECPVITNTITTSATTKKSTRCPITQQDLNKFSIMTMVSKKQKAIVVTVLTGSVVVIVIVLWKRGKEMKICCNYLCMPDIEKKMDERMHDHTLFKMKLKVNFQDIITKINSNEIVDKLTLNNFEKQSVLESACLGRIKGNKALLDIVLNRGPVVYKEFIKVLRQNIPRLAFKIENTKESDHKEDVEEELVKMYNENIPENIRSFHESQIKIWLDEDKTIVQTKASIHILELLQKKNCVVLVGGPGSGKSSILRHIALKLVKKDEKEDFDIIPVVIEPSTVFQYHNKRRNQIFLLDDFCGKDKVNNQILDLWKFEIEKFLDIVNQGDCFDQCVTTVSNRKTIILISCNTNVYNDKYFEKLRTRFGTMVFELSEIPLTPEERESMIKKYADPNAKIEPSVYDRKEMKLDFPLLCKLSKGKPIDEINRLFSDPLKTIEDDLKKVQSKDNLQFCTIALCTLFNNEFKRQWLNMNCEQDNIRMEKLSALCQEFNYDISNDADRTLIQEKFEKEQTDWLCKSGDTYHLIHDAIFDIASIICGESYHRCFINHAPISFIAKRYNFNKDIDGLITLKSKYHKLYFDRLFRDLEHGSSYSTFQNLQLKNEAYRQLFINYCNDRVLKFKELLGNIKSDKPDKKTLYRQDTIDFDLKVPLIDCASQGYEYMVDLLLEMNCDVNAIDDNERSSLYVASEKGHFTIVKRLIENKPDGAKVTSSDKNKKTSLHMACKEGHIKVAEYLIDNGADISACDMDGSTSLHLACASGNTDIVQLLLSKKRDGINQIDNYGRRPIIVASSHGQTEVVEKLLQFDETQVNRTDTKGLTALLSACLTGFPNTVDILIKKNSNVNHCDNDRRSALFIACEKGHTKIAEKVIQMGEKGIIETCDWHKRSPLYIACVEGRTETAQLLINKGANINHCDEDNKSPIYVACEKSNEKIVEILLKGGAEINKGDRHWNVPLHVACKAGDKKIVKLLQDHKDCSTIKNKWNQTALDVAIKHGHGNILNFTNAT